MEDLFPAPLLRAFDEENPRAVRRSATVEDRTHRDLTPDGKARFHRFVKQNAILSDLAEVVATVSAIRSYLGLPVVVPVLDS